MKLHAHISKEGELLIPDRAILQNWVKSNQGKDVELEIKVRRKKRSTYQNKYYWGVIVDAFYQIFRNAGIEVQDEHDVHEILKAKFNTEKIVNEQSGEVLEIPKSTARNNTFEQEEYHERCRKWAGEFWGVFIALPNEQMEIDTIILSGAQVNGTTVIIAEQG